MDSSVEAHQTFNELRDSVTDLLSTCCCNLGCDWVETVPTKHVADAAEACNGEISAFLKPFDEANQAFLSSFVDLKRREAQTHLSVAIIALAKSGACWYVQQPCSAASTHC